MHICRERLWGRVRDLLMAVCATTRLQTAGRHWISGAVYLVLYLWYCISGTGYLVGVTLRHLWMSQSQQIARRHRSWACKGIMSNQDATIYEALLCLMLFTVANRCTMACLLCIIFTDSKLAKQTSFRRHITRLSRPINWAYQLTSSFTMLHRLVRVRAAHKLKVL